MNIISKQKQANLVQFALFGRGGIPQTTLECSHLGSYLIEKNSFSAPTKPSKDNGIRCLAVEEPNCKVKEHYTTSHKKFIMHLLLN